MISHQKLFTYLGVKYFQNKNKRKSEFSSLMAQLNALNLPHKTKSRSPGWNTALHHVRQIFKRQSFSSGRALSAHWWDWDGSHGRRVEVWAKYREELRILKRAQIIQWKGFSVAVRHQRKKINAWRTCIKKKLLCYWLVRSASFEAAPAFRIRLWLLY